MLAAQIGVPHSEVDQLLANIVASSWLIGAQNATAQSLDPLLEGGWNVIVQQALRTL